MDQNEIERGENEKKSKFKNDKYKQYACPPKQIYFFYKSYDRELKEVPKLETSYS